MKSGPHIVRKSGFVECPECGDGSCRLAYRGTWQLDSAKMGIDKDGDPAVLCSIDVSGVRASLECLACGYSAVQNVELEDGDSNGQSNQEG